MSESWHEFIDCRHYDTEAEPIRGCLVGRIAPIDCHTCTQYDPEPIFDWREDLKAMDDG